MGLFKGQLYNDTPANHLFCCNHPAFLYAGLASFNMNLIYQIVMTPSLHPTIKEGFLKHTGRRINIPTISPNEFGDLTSAEKLAKITVATFPFFVEMLEAVNFTFKTGNPDWNNPVTFQYRKYNFGTKKFSNATMRLNSALALIAWYEGLYLPDPETYKEENAALYKKNIEEIYGIQLCTRGFLEINNDPDVVPLGRELAESEKIYFRLYFIDKNDLDSSRIVVPKGEPQFTALPKRPTGKAYSLNSTNSLDTGAYADVADDRKGVADPKEMVSARLRTSYNSALKCHDIQNQIIAILLEDLSPAAIAVPNLDNLDNIPQNQFYAPDGEKYLGAFTTAEAMPVGLENGNPYMFGPNLLVCDDTTVEKIRVVNRSPRSFTKNQRVLCHFIGNEWIVTELGDPVETEPAATTVGRWQFAKFIANSNNHFKPAGYGPDFETNEDVKGFLPIRPASLVEALRYQFYTGKNTTSDVILNANSPDPDKMRAINENPNWLPNGGIMQTSIFDQYKLGANYIKTNPAASNGGEQYETVCPLFFGPVFNDGFQKKNIPSSAIPAYNSSSQGSIPISTSLVAAGNLELIRTVHLPAEVAINGPWGTHSSPIDDYQEIVYNMARNDYDFVSDGSYQNYKYWMDDGEVKDFGLVPISNNKVQFIAMSCQFGCADDLFAVDEYVNRSSERAFRTHALDIESSNSSTEGEKTCVAGLGDALDRGQTASTPLARNIYNGSAPQSIEGNRTISYDHYNNSVRDTNQNTPVDPFVGTDSDSYGSEIVSIITARNKVIRPNGGDVNLTTTFRFGQGGTKHYQRTNAQTHGIASAFSGLSFTAPSSSEIGASSGWGNTSNDIWDFGVCNLHVKIYDWWPEDQTLFVAPYFTVLHFNPGRWGSDAATKQGNFKVNNDGLPDFTKNYTNEQVESEPNETFISLEIVDTEKLTDVDTRIPTFYNNGLSFLDVGDQFDENTELVPEEYWLVNTGRRGAMLSGSNITDPVTGASYGGYLYTRLEMGLSSAGVEVIDAGTNFEVGQVYNGPKGVSIKVLSVTDVGGIATFEFAPIEDDSITALLEDQISKYVPQGVGFRPSDFPYDLNISATEGTAANIRFPKGIVYQALGIDKGPQLRYGGENGRSLVPGGHREGNTQPTGSQTTKAVLEDNSNTKYPGQYEAFYYFHCDMGMAYEKEFTGGGTNCHKVQHIDITIT